MFFFFFPVETLSVIIEYLGFTVEILILQLMLGFGGHVQGLALECCDGCITDA